MENVSSYYQEFLSNNTMSYIKTKMFMTSIQWELYSNGYDIDSMVDLLNSGDFISRLSNDGGNIEEVIEFVNSMELVSLNSMKGFASENSVVSIYLGNYIFVDHHKTNGKMIAFMHLTPLGKAEEEDILEAGISIRDIISEGIKEYKIYFNEMEKGNIPRPDYLLATTNSKSLNKLIENRYRRNPNLFTDLIVEENTKTFVFNIDEMHNFFNKLPLGSSSV